MSDPKRTASPDRTWDRRQEGATSAEAAPRGFPTPEPGRLPLEQVPPLHGRLRTLLGRVDIPLPIVVAGVAVVAAIVAALRSGWLPHSAEPAARATLWGLAVLFALSEALVHLRQIRPRGRLPWFHTTAKLAAAVAVVARLADRTDSGAEGLLGTFMVATGVVGLAGLVDVWLGLRRGLFSRWTAASLAAGALGMICISWMLVVCPLLFPDVEAAWKYPFFATLPLIVIDFLGVSRVRREDAQAAAGE